MDEIVINDELIIFVVNLINYSPNWIFLGLEYHFNKVYLVYQNLSLLNEELGYFPINHMMIIYYKLDYLIRISKILIIIVNLDDESYLSHVYQLFIVLSFNNRFKHCCEIKILSWIILLNYFHRVYYNWNFN